MTAKSFRSESGLTTESDPVRLVFYSPCGFWSDDWSTISKHNDSGIPCCPNCGSVGFQTTAKDWEEGCRVFQRRGNPGYVNFIKDLKEDCFQREVSLLDEYQNWLTQHPNGRVLPNPRAG